MGTTSIEKNEYLSTLLKNKGVPHQLLNAKNHEKEAEIIAGAGEKGAVTVATNMAGRGVDIVLGGSLPAKLEDKKLITPLIWLNWYVSSFNYYGIIYFLPIVLNEKSEIIKAKIKA